MSGKIQTADGGLVGVGDTVWIVHTTGNVELGVSLTEGEVTGYTQEGIYVTATAAGMPKLLWSSDHVYSSRASARLFMRDAVIVAMENLRRTTEAMQKFVDTFVEGGEV